MAKEGKVKLVALKRFRGPEGAKNGDPEGLVRKGQVFDASVMRAARLMYKGMAEIHNPVKAGPSLNKKEEPVETKSEVREVDPIVGDEVPVEEEKPKRGRKPKEEPVDEPDSGSDVS